MKDKMDMMNGCDFIHPEEAESLWIKNSNKVSDEGKKENSLSEYGENGKDIMNPSEENR